MIIVVSHVDASSVASVCPLLYVTVITPPVTGVLSSSKYNCDFTKTACLDSFITCCVVVSGTVVTSTGPKLTTSPIVVPFGIVPPDLTVCLITFPLATDSSFTYRISPTFNPAAEIELLASFSSCC